VTTRCAVIQFPGSNCDADAVRAIGEVTGERVDLVWHTDHSLAGYDLVVLPGGFSYGDYLRSGAIARTSPVMRALIEAADRGVAILGICNGFQILTEAGLLPGALRSNTSLRFRCMHVEVTVERTDTPFTIACHEQQILRLPIAHAHGSYTAPADVLEEIEANDQVVLRYTDNPNGSSNDIAVVCNAAGNVVGMMPHPERATSELLGSDHGRLLFLSLLNSTLGLAHA
jgi:phosphoribosylformylglycinamidine synthase